MASPPQAGSILGDRYVLAEALGDAPGFVEYRALDKELEVEISLWWLRPELFRDPARRDAVIGAGVELRHVNDIELRQCFGVGGGKGGLWAIWRLASGPGPVPGAEPVSVVEIRRWLDAAGRGLVALHRHGLVHGRMSPQDVVAIGDTLKLGGGGLWRDAEPAAAARMWGDWYVAPEVRAGQPPTEAADVWSLAAIALQMVAVVPASSPDAAKAAARRHPQLAAVLVGAMSSDPGRRPGVPELVEAAKNAAEYPYLSEQAPRGKGAPRSSASTELGVPPAPRISGPQPVARPDPTPPPAKPPQVPTPHGFDSAATPVRVKAPSAAPPAPKAAIPTPARTAIEAATERVRTAAPGEYKVAAVSMKTPKAVSNQPEVAPGTPVLPKATIRPYAEAVPSARTFSVAPGQMGYLAPPKAVSDAKKRRRGLLLLLLIAFVAAGGGVALALLL
jgi:hypothetical protein